MTQLSSPFSTQPDVLDEVAKILAQRKTTYGQAWLKTGAILPLLKEDMGPMFDSGFFFAWLMVFNKLIRLLAQPRHKDSWQDIVGYAQLVLEQLEGVEHVVSDQ